MRTLYWNNFWNNRLEYMKLVLEEYHTYTFIIPEITQ